MGKQSMSNVRYYVSGWSPGSAIDKMTEIDTIPSEDQPVFNEYASKVLKDDLVECMKAAENEEQTKTCVTTFS